MIKTVSILTIACLLNIACRQSPKKSNSLPNSKNTVKTADLNGKVKSIITLIFSTDPSFNSLHKGPLINKSLTAYDTAGHAIEQIIYNKDNTVNQKISTVYDAKGNVIENDYYYEALHSISKLITKYDANAQKIMEENFDKDSLTSTIKYSYNEKHLLMSVLRYDGKSVLLYKTDYTYDDDENRITESRIDPEGNAIYKIANKYDNHQNNTEKVCNDEAGHLQYAYKYTYNDEKRITEFLNYDSENNLTHRTTFKYNNQGKMIETSNFDSKLGSTQTQKNSFKDYDQHDNPIFIITYISEIPASITENKITYY